MTIRGCGGKGGGLKRIDMFGHPYNAAICLYKTWRTKRFFQLKIIINVIINILLLQRADRL